MNHLLWIFGSSSSSSSYMLVVLTRNVNVLELIHGLSATCVGGLWNRSERKFRNTNNTKKISRHLRNIPSASSTSQPSNANERQVDSLRRLFHFVYMLTSISVNGIKPEGERRVRVLLWSRALFTVLIFVTVSVCARVEHRIIAVVSSNNTRTRLRFGHFCVIFEKPRISKCLVCRNRLSSNLIGWLV